MKSDVKFRDDSHRARWSAAVQTANAVMEGGRVETDFAASLYILTADPDLYERIRKHVHQHWMDFEEMLRMGLSAGECVLVALAGNLYNGGFYAERGLSPLDIVTRCDEKSVALAVMALAMRKQTTYIT